MELHKTDVLRLKKSHPCGSDLCEVLREGMEFRLRCLGCGHSWEMPRSKLEKSVREIRPGGNNS